MNMIELRDALDADPVEFETRVYTSGKFEKDRSLQRSGYINNPSAANPRQPSTRSVVPHQQLLSIGHANLKFGSRIGCREIGVEAVAPGGEFQGLSAQESLV